MPPKMGHPPAGRLRLGGSPQQGIRRQFFFGFYNPGLWHLIRKGNFDAILCSVGYVRASFWIAFAAASLANSAFLFGTDATSLLPRDSRNWKVSVKKLLWPRLFRLADQVIVPSSAGVAMMRSPGLPHDRVTLTPYVVDNDWWAAQVSRIDRAAVRYSSGVAHVRRDAESLWAKPTARLRLAHR